MTIKVLFCLSFFANAVFACCWLANEAAPPTIPKMVILTGIGIGYCSPENCDKETDFELVGAIATAVEGECNSWLARQWR